MTVQIEEIQETPTEKPNKMAKAIVSSAALFYLYTFAVLALNHFTPSLPPILWILITCLSTVCYLLIIVYSIRMLARPVLSTSMECLFLFVSLLIFLSLNPLVWQAISLLRQGRGLWDVFSALISEGDSLLSTIAPFFIMLAGVFFGRLVAKLIREASLLVPVALVSGMIDFWGVYWGFVNAASSSAPVAVSGLGSAVTTVAKVPESAVKNLPEAMTMLLQLAPPESIGIGDFVFLALLITCAYRLGFSAGRAMWGLFTGLLVASFIMAFDGRHLFGHEITIAYLPGLVFICGGFLLFNLRNWKLSRQEWLMTGVLVIIIGSGITYSIASNFQRKPVLEPSVEYKLSALSAEDAVSQVVERISNSHPSMETLPVQADFLYSMDEEKIILSKWNVTVLSRRSKVTVRNTRAFNVAGILTKDKKSWKAAQQSIPLPEKSETVDPVALVKSAKPLQPSYWDLLHHAVEYTKPVKGQQSFIIRLSRDGVFLYDEDGKLLRKLEY